MLNKKLTWQGRKENRKKYRLNSKREKGKRLTINSI
jgi:hypothetical protein